MPAPLPSSLVAEAGRLLYGEEWQSPLARDLDLNLRTVQRIAAAAAKGEPYRIAPGVLAELVERLAKHASDCMALRAELARLVD